ncbi:MAG: tetratricopeptide repeat protein, partial [Burkholderiales bacterium]
YFQLRDYKSAIEAQRKLLSAYPNSPKVPDALLNLGSAELGLGDPAAARKTWDELIAKHPSTEAAEKARQRLSRLR